MTYKEFFDSLSEKEQRKALLYREFSINLKNIRGRIGLPFYAIEESDERFPNIHELKILPEYFEALLECEKEFELRKDDRDYRVGDILVLEKWDGEKYTGDYLQCKIKYILRNCPEYGLADGYCILGF